MWVIWLFGYSVIRKVRFPVLDITVHFTNVVSSRVVVRVIIASMCLCDGKSSYTAIDLGTGEPSLCFGAKMSKVKCQGQKFILYVKQFWIIGSAGERKSR